MNGMQRSRRIRALALGLVLGLGLSACTAQDGGDDLLTTLMHGPKTKVERGSFLELTFDGPMRDGPAPSPFATLSTRGPGSMWDARRALLAAAKDERIAGVRLEIEGVQLGFGALEELAGLLDSVRTAGKPIYAYLRNDFSSDADYYLALSADRIYVAPASALLVNGLRAEVNFWRGTLEKLGVVPHVLMFKEYKSAGEPLGRYTMSEAFREALRAVLVDMEEALVQRISMRRGLPPVQVRAGLELGLMTVPEALQTGWVDALGYRETVEHALAGVAKTGKYRGIEVRKYLRAIDPPGRKSGFDFANLGAEKKPTIALVFGEGPIIAADQANPFDALFGGETVIRGLEVAKAIDEASEDPNVKAIVFRVDSPGGSAVGSDHVRDAVRRARDRGKKFVVSMASVAGSGGYWISMDADKIVAQKTTITGSIGVVSMQFDVRGFYEWIGSHVDVVSLSKGSGLTSSVEPFDEGRRERWMAWMGAVYEDFKTHVAQGRRMKPEAVEAVAKGRIWSGADAKEKGLVDALGGLTQAVELACSLSGIARPEAAELQIYPKKDLMEELFSNMFGVAVQARPAEALLRTLDPAVLQDLARPRVLVLQPQIRID